MKPESKFRQSQVLPFLKSLRNTYAFPIQQMGLHGDPDFLICCHGEFIALELKIDSKKPRKLQQFKLDQVARCGGTALVATPSNWEQIKLIISKLDKGETNESAKNKNHLQ